MADYPEEVNEVLLQKHGDTFASNADRMNTRYNVAKTLLEQEYSHLSSELEVKAGERHDAELSEWDLSLETLSRAGDVLRWAPSIYSNFTRSFSCSKGS